MRVSFKTTTNETVANETVNKLVKAGVEKWRITVKLLNSDYTVFITEVRNWSEIFELEEALGEI